MEEISFSSLLIVCVVAFAVPLLLGLAPSVRLPAIVLEIVAGIALGPAGLGWVEPDAVIAVFALVGLAFLLFLSGLEIDLEGLRGRRLRLTGAGFALSFVLALAVATGLRAAGQVETPLFVAIVLVATALGVVVPVLKDAGRAGSELGQLVIAAASIADFGAVILLSIFFSRESSGTGAKLVLLGGFLAVAAAAAVGLARLAGRMRVADVLVRLQDTTAQIRVRGAFLLLVAFAALASRLGLEVILGAFMAGAILSFVDRDRRMTHPQFRLKLEAAGFGFFIPVFFVSSGLRFDLAALTESTSALALVPVFLAALLLVRGAPAYLYRRTLGPRETAAAGLLQATSLPFVVAATMIGTELGVVSRATAAALVAAGLLSVVLFPLLALTLLRRGESRRRAPAAGAGTVHGLEGKRVLVTGGTAGIGQAMAWPGARRGVRQPDG